MDLAVGAVHEAIAAALADREALVAGPRRLTWQQLAERTRRLANVLHGAGLGCHTERDHLAPWESGQDHLALYLHNGSEYLEGMLGAFKARVAPFNVNYRYVADELRVLFADAAPAAIVFHSAFAPMVATVAPAVPSLRLLLQVADGSGHDLVPGAQWYETALARAAAAPPPVTPSPDDLYILYTGGTTGRPKGVLWRQGDAWTECFGGSPTTTTVEQAVADASVGLRALIAPPLMHGAGHWMSLRTWHLGGTVFLASRPTHFDPADIWALVERERLSFLLIVGDAFARPLLDELDRGRPDVSSLTVLLSGGAPLSAGLKERFLERVPGLLIVDGLGSSEAGGQVSHISTVRGATSGVFEAAPDNHVVSADLDRVLPPGDPELGWLAKSGRLALGYLHDPAKTRRTYLELDGRRFAIPGDRARWLGPDRIELHGRDAVTINSGGEKVFAEEVEAALKHHADVIDCVVAGRPSTRWGEEVVALVSVRAGAEVSPSELVASCADHLARYKLPKAVVFVPEVQRSPAGKADYRWARAMAAGSADEGLITR